MLTTLVSLTLVYILHYPNPNNNPMSEFKIKILGIILILASTTYLILYMIYN
jgi:hypothetical protein